MSNNKDMFAVNTNKAGMEGLDKEKINSIIYEASKNSKYFQNQQRKQKELDDKIAKLTAQYESITSAKLAEALVKVDCLVAELEESRDFSRFIVHVDMDAFFAAVEMKDNPSLKHKPMAVGSSQMLSTSNYVARKFGVRAGMPGFIAQKLCPSLIITPLNFEKYKEYSSQIENILITYDPELLMASLDEAYMDLTQHMILRQDFNDEQRTHEILQEDGTFKSIVFGKSIEEAVREMRLVIFTKTTLTISAGIAPNKLLAKICSDMNKPNGQYYLSFNTYAVKTFLSDLPVRKVNGIGKISSALLASLKINTVGDLWEKRAEISLVFPSSTWLYFLRVSLGIGSTLIEQVGERKSMSFERTFSDTSDIDFLHSSCRTMVEELHGKCLESNILSKTITVKTKSATFDILSKAFSFKAPTNDLKAMTDAALVSLNACLAQHKCLRLLGVRLSSFTPKLSQKPIEAFVTATQSNTNVNTDSTSNELDIIPLSPSQPSCSTSDKSSIPAGSPQNKNVTTKDLTNSDIVSSHCPVCFVKLKLTLLEFNQHVDLCLNGDEIKNASNQPSTSNSGIDQRKRNSADKPSKAKRRKENNSPLKASDLRYFFESVH